MNKLTGTRVFCIFLLIFTASAFAQQDIDVQSLLAGSLQKYDLKIPLLDTASLTDLKKQVEGNILKLESTHLRLGATAEADEILRNSPDYGIAHQNFQAKLINGLLEYRTSIDSLIELTVQGSTQLKLEKVKLQSQIDEVKLKVLVLDHNQKTRELRKLRKEEIKHLKYVFNQARNRIKLVIGNIEFRLTEKYQEMFSNLSQSNDAYDFYIAMPSENISRSLAYGLGNTGLYLLFYGGLASVPVASVIMGAIATPAYLAGIAIWAMVGGITVSTIDDWHEGLPGAMGNWKKKLKKKLAKFDAIDHQGNTVEGVKSKKEFAKINSELAKVVFKDCTTKNCVTQLVLDYKFWIDQSATYDQKIKLGKETTIS